MKRSIFAFAAALAALVACNKNEATPMQPQNQELLVPCELTVGICIATRNRIADSIISSLLVISLIF